MTGNPTRGLRTERCSCGRDAIAELESERISDSDELVAAYPLAQVERITQTVICECGREVQVQVYP